MNALTAAIYAQLAGDTTLAAMLAMYKGASAIISADPVPFDVTRPYVVIRGAMHDESFGGKVDDTTGREVHLDIAAYTDATGSSAAIDSIAERIRALLHKVPLTVGSFNNLIAQCTAGPLQVPTDPRIMGRVLTFRWVLD